jgi:hypothetical protein
MIALKEDFKLEKLNWTFFATSHGKGAVDGIGFAVKRFTWNQVRSKKLIIRNASDFVQLCKEAHDLGKLKPKVLLCTEDEINVTKEFMTKLWESCRAIKGTQKIPEGTDPAC